MPVDNTVLDLIMSGDFAAAQDALEAGHPDEYANTIQAAVLRAVNAGIAHSGSSNTIASSGSKIFTLDEARNWVAGTPVFILEVASPTVNFMRGVLSIDEATKVITVTIQGSGGTGTFSSWNIVALFHTTTTASPPLGIIDGGTGGTTEATARANFEVIRSFPILDVQSTPPGSPTTGDMYLVGDAPTGAWAAEENNIAVWATPTAAVWNFQTPLEGDQAWNPVLNRQYFYSDSATGPNKRPWVGSKWGELARPGNLNPEAVTSTSTLAISSLSGNLIRCHTHAGITVTIPDAAAGEGYWLHVVNEDAVNNVTLNVASAGTINGASTLVLTPNQAAYLFSNGPTVWYAVTNQ